jgi:hypothetical protein
MDYTEFRMGWDYHHLGCSGKGGPGESSQEAKKPDDLFEVKRAKDTSASTSDLWPTVQA